MTDPTPGRDRLRELLDAVLDEENTRLTDMAGHAFASPFHFTRRFTRDTGESPVALRRRVLLERAAWQIGQGSSVTDAAFAAGYESVEGFTRAFGRAFGRPPSSTTPGSGTWLSAPNGIHFHPPIHLWIEEEPKAGSGMDLIALQVHHDVDDTAHLLRVAADLPEEAYRRTRAPGRTVLEWDGPEESIAAVLGHLVYTKETWLASIDGADLPERGANDPRSLWERHVRVSARWIAAVEDIGRRGAWGDRLIDALCDPPESFVLGSVIAHVLTFSAHRRQLVRHMLREQGLAVDHGDPIAWLRNRHDNGGTQ